MLHLRVHRKPVLEFNERCDMVSVLRLIDDFGSKVLDRNEVVKCDYREEGCNSEEERLP